MKEINEIAGKSECSLDETEKLIWEFIRGVPGDGRPVYFIGNFFLIYGGTND